MPIMLRRLLLGALGLALLALGDWGAASEAAEVSCDVAAAAGKPRPAPPDPGPDGQFRIFWQISTQVEAIADAASNPTAMSDIREARDLVSGYYINALLGGPLIYWPDRPKECRLNFKRIDEGDSIEVEGETFTFAEGGAKGHAACVRQQDPYLRSKSKAADPGKDVHIDALRRVFRNLDLSAEQKAGKAVWAVALILVTDFIYDKAKDKVRLAELPETYCVLNASGITLNGLMIYQEPKLQTRRGRFVHIPRKNPRGELFYSTPRQDKLPENTHAFQLIAGSFDEAGVPIGGFRANVRRWRERHSEALARELVKIPQFGGFNFEGGTGMLAVARKSPERLITGVSWILANTKSDISFLMPGYWDRDMVGNEDEVDTQIARLRQLIMVINTGLNAKMQLPPGQNAVCSNRLVFIVGSYGQPVHVKSLPMRRADGQLAGTVTGQIRLLADLRKELCGS